MADNQGTSQLFGDSLPGTGGDYIDSTDVEGHMTNKHLDPKPVGNSDETATDDTEGHNKYGPGGSLAGAIPDEAGPDKSSNGAIRHPNVVDSDDTQGHAGKVTLPGGVPVTGEGEPDEFSNKRLFRDFDGGTDDDTEGHLFTGGPSTQDEFAKRGPGENPHGER